MDGFGELVHKGGDGGHVVGSYKTCDQLHPYKGA